LCVRICRDRCITSALVVGKQEGRDTSVPTVAEASLPHEDVVVQRWSSLMPGTMLPLMHGGMCHLVFGGRPGGPVGPDVRDAVLLFAQGEQCVGDIEFHVRASDWVAHKHNTDPRYNNVMLHVVLLCDDLDPTMRQDGYSVPVCSLYDFPIVFPSVIGDESRAEWPCHMVMRCVSLAEQERLLHRAGLLRFEQKTHAFVEELHTVEREEWSIMDTNGRPQGCAPTIDDEHDAVSSIVGAHPCGRPSSLSSPSSLLSTLYNNCLIPALAEALAYGRDRAFFRAAGQRLLDQNAYVPEPLGRASNPSPLDAKRLDVLRKLLAREQNVWQDMQGILCQQERAEETTLQALRNYFCSVGLSLARTDILVCNVVLPFAAAIALLEHNTVLGERAQRLYEMHPGLSSNTITRMMCVQLLLASEPRGSCKQQGLQYIYQQTCQAKHCAECIMGRNIL